ncbi:DUF6048 family protein [Reichenbachiella ulvae]|uniref:DUF6048 family protein n=1 Tax=Reichenbachiella ulvae TaxID=2980104 RepID=A0ABT3CVL2_9BACT|nr:DUF6048 family protein [Reichenbachiella ulvae]MCV9387708.1 DUF6048 family protein [Reichenbachiella ulvae]
MKISKYIFFSFSLLFITKTLSAQEYIYEKRERDWKPSEVFFSADVVGLGRLISGDIQSEFQTKIDFDQFYLALDGGRSDLSSSGNGFNYSSSGYFFRVGPQANLIPYNKNRSSIFFGVNYAQSLFSDQIDYRVIQSAWGEQDLSFKNDNLTARWFEANLGIQARIFGPIYLGYTIRFKMAKKLSGEGVLEAYEIPGFGRASSSATFGFNYYIIYRLGFRDKPIPAKPRKIKVKDENDSN